MSYEWMDKALCRETDSELFFPDNVRDHRLAVRVCRSCEVITDCLNYALSRPVAGIWGGTAEPERRRLRARLAS